ncbi:alkaline phosphatase family protein [Aliiglaciecola sp. M165]|uniref:alkaline phosphatase family protein n=1 Tax=Aliiglaciecola sp. M165 TaxID=2593649 RepID=UPI001181292D|nr:alkaline phosphatase family protein [Aliiglaciecola sp. M165]TRY33197.1 alkaline phosphatase family protein [Aliiglaciecola sp. M165]
MPISDSVTPSNNYVIHRSSNTNNYSLYQFSPDKAELFTPVATDQPGTFDESWQFIQSGQYVLQWGPLTQQAGKNGYPFKVVKFDPASSDPLNETSIQSGFWDKNKFFDYRAYYSTDPNQGNNIELTSVGSFVLNTLFSEGRGTFRLFNFDACPTPTGPQDPLPSYFGLGQGNFPLIKKGHTLIPIGNYVLDRHPDGHSFTIWSFDPQQPVPLSLPAITQGRWSDINHEHQLIAIGDVILDWRKRDNYYRLWSFNPDSDSGLVGPLREGTLPDYIDNDSLLTPFQSIAPVQTAPAPSAGSMEFMRSKIKHVVYYMVESRSFDNVLGWLYEKDEEKCHFIGSDQPFEGASTEDYNEFQGDKIKVSKFKDGQLSDQWNLMALQQDPFHNTMDGLQQMFTDVEGYWQNGQPDMGGFVLNNANPQVMETFSAEQLPVLNGLAKAFAVSDQWFCSMPGGTDVNRGFSVTGSAYNKLGTWEGGDAYEYFPDSPHRQSIWKVLWNYGISDWKIYYSMEWKGGIFTNQLYLKGQIPTVDANPDDYFAQFDQFITDAKSGSLPAFSYLEPYWYKKKGTTSYHPGCDLVPAEVALNSIYNAIKQGPAWEETLLVVTFDKNNGIYDHVKPPYARKPWPNDLNNGFSYNLMGPRVPAVFVSPWIKPHTVLRSEQDAPFDSTSFAATLLHWFGIPKDKWALGDRMEVAPTFESVFQQSQARTDAPNLVPPYDKTYPKKE